MYTTTNFLTKKELEQAVASGDYVSYWQFEKLPVIQDGTFVVEGPHCCISEREKLHTWYATCTAKNGSIIKVS